MGGRATNLVLQYWLYYPTNDSGNTHEGDWEHLNIMIAPREQVITPLDEATLMSVLDGRIAAESVEIRKIEYYFYGDRRR